MSASPILHGVFGHFQNLNLIILMDDLRTGRAAKGAWAAGSHLCPVAHGMPAGQIVNELRFLGQAAHLERGCDYAARYLGGDQLRVCQFVNLWDCHAYSEAWLLRELEDLWQERRSDADAVQAILTCSRYEPASNGAIEPTQPLREHQEYASGLSLEQRG